MNSINNRSLFIAFLTIINWINVYCLDLYKIGGLRKNSHVDSALRNVPEWINEYIKWHGEQRLQKDPSTKYLVLACHRGFACGGLSDRLQSLPYFLLAAYKTKRLLFIKWEKFELSDFLTPPPGGLDWRLPSEIEIERPYSVPSCETHVGKCRNVWDLDQNKEVISVNSRHDLYADFKDEYFVSNLKPEGVYTDIMRIFFEPVTPLKMMIRKTMKKLGLRPRKYLAAHFRQRYPNLAHRRAGIEAQMSDDLRTTILDNSVSCVVHATGSKDMPVYFTSDKDQNVAYMLHQSRYAYNQETQVIGIESMFRKNLDEEYEGYEPEDFYPVFVDLYLMANSKCVSYGQGGYGRFAARIADEKCMIQHQELWEPLPCHSN